MADATFTIASDADEGWYDVPATFDPNKFVCNFGGTSADRSWHRYRLLGIPQGAEILTAYMRFQSAVSSGSSGAAVFAAHDVDSATNPTSTSTYNSKHGERTTAQVTWNYGARSNDAYYNTSSLVSIIQEIVNRPGWAAGNYILMMGMESSGAGFSGNGWTSGADLPTLYVEWATDAPVTDTALASTNVLTLDTLARAPLQDTLLESVNSLYLDVLSGLAYVADTELAEPNTLYIDTLGLATVIADTLLQGTNTLYLDVLGALRSLTDTSLLSANVLTLDTITEVLNGVFSPYWVWQFVRQDGNLLLVPSKNLQAWKPEGSEVSVRFRYNSGLDRFTQNVVAAAWAANSGADTATLKAAIDAALSTAGMLAPNGDPL